MCAVQICRYKTKQKIKNAIKIDHHETFTSDKFILLFFFGEFCETGSGRHFHVCKAISWFKSKDQLISSLYEFGDIHFDTKEVSHHYLHHIESFKFHFKAIFSKLT